MAQVEVEHKVTRKQMKRLRKRLYSKFLCCTYVTVPCKIEDYSVTCFDCFAVFEVPYCWTFIKGGAHTYLVDPRISNESTKRVWAPPLTKVQQYDTLNTAMRLKYATEGSSISTQDCHIFVCSTVGWFSSLPLFLHVTDDVIFHVLTGSCRFCCFLWTTCTLFTIQIILYVY